MVVDTRNSYETAIVAGAVDPETKHFRDFPAWAETWPPCLRIKSKKLACSVQAGSDVKNQL